MSTAALLLEPKSTRLGALVLPPRSRMIAALQSHDARYAQRFIIAVRTTKIYCVPGCPAPCPKPENVDFVASIEEARALGCRACKRCHPDIAFYGISPDGVKFEGLARKIWERPERFEGVEAMAKEAGVGGSRLHEGMRMAYHRTPLEFLNSAKVADAARRLLEPGAQASEVALEAGFASSSVFYQQFGRAMGMTPAAYGRLRSDTQFQIELPDHFPVGAFRTYLDREAENPLTRKVGEQFEMRLSGGGLFRFELHVNGINVEVDQPGDGPAAHQRVVRMGALAKDTTGIETFPATAKLASGRPGLRVFQTVDLFDSILWAIVGQQLTLSFAVKLRHRLYELLRTGPHPWAPLEPHELRQVSVEQLLGRQYSGRKAEYLLAAARAFEGYSEEDMRLWSYAKVTRFLESLRGFGPWSTNYVLMRGFGFADCVPIGDVVLAEALKQYFGLEARPGPKEQEQLMTSFSPHRSLATYHLWHSGGVVA